MILNCHFIRPLPGLSLLTCSLPSDKSLGYFQKVRFADYWYRLLRAILTAHPAHPAGPHIHKPKAGPIKQFPTNCLIDPAGQSRFDFRPPTETFRDWGEGIKRTG
jgi:hypothetical protein